MILALSKQTATFVSRRTYVEWNGDDILGFLIDLFRSLAHQPQHLLLGLTGLPPAALVNRIGLQNGFRIWWRCRCAVPSVHSLLLLPPFGLLLLVLWIRRTATFRGISRAVPSVYSLLLLPPFGSLLLVLWIRRSDTFRRISRAGSWWFSVRVEQSPHCYAYLNHYVNGFFSYFFPSFL